LDFGAELWKWDVSLYESEDGIRTALARAGRPFDDESILFDATRSLLGDVVEAAGGVESAHGRFTRSVASAQQRYEIWVAGPGSDHSDQAEPEFALIIHEVRWSAWPVVVGDLHLRC
jgi:hypothetical protein